MSRTLTSALSYLKRKFIGIGDAPDFEAPLITSINPRFGQGLPSFTRTSIATVTDFEGNIITVKSGEARFEGARRVENLFTSSEILATQDISTNAGNYTISFTGTGTITFTGSYSGSLIGQGATTRVSTTIASSAGTLTCTISGSVLKAQAETGENTSEYVSVGVLSAPYHGSNVDGVKCFATLNGNTVASNVVTEATGGLLQTTDYYGYFREEEATNLLLWSEDIGNAAWIKQGSLTYTTNTHVAPNGTQTADTITRNNISTDYIYQLLGNIGIYTLSVWVRATSGTKDFTILSYNSTDGAQQSPTYTATTTWQRFSFTTTVTTSSSWYPAVTNSAGDIVIWGSQLETGSAPSSPILTNSTSATREADVLTYQVNRNVIDLSGSAYAEVTASDWSNVTGQYLGDGVEAILQASASNSGVQSYDGTNTANGPSGTPSGQMKVASSWATSVLKAFSNGVKGTDGSYDGSFSLAQLNIGSGYNGTIKNLKIWKKALTDTQLTQLTK